MGTSRKQGALANRVTLVTGEDRLRSFFAIAEKELHYEKTSSIPTPKIAAISRQSERLRKRGRVRPAGISLRDKAFSDFENVNEVCGNIVPVLRGDIRSDAADFIQRTLQCYTSRYPGTHQSTLDIGALLNMWKFGPGASIGCEFTHFVDKIHQTSTTVTEDILRYAKIRRYHDDRLRTFDGEMAQSFVIVRGSSLNSVPKNESTDRTICTEPLENMTLQLAAGTYISEALKYIGMDIACQQPKNKRLAEVGSFDGSMATVDLKSASDLISIDLIRSLWPPEWFEFFMAIRSPETLISGRWVKLNMMSTMGNGFTFPMMTLTLLSLVYATQSYRCNKRHFIDWSNTAVYGDDIIVPTEDYDALCENLSDAGFIINYDKSYVEGPFRESCGGDYWEGVDITPFYVESLSTDPEIYVAINKIHDWSRKTGIYLYACINYLLSLISRDPLLVPYWSNPTEGVRHGEVCGRYKSWLPVKKVINFDLSCSHHSIAMMMCIGGYITSTSASVRVHGSRDVSFISRVLDTRYELVDLRTPRGVLNGYDYGFRNCGSDKIIDTNFNLVLLSIREERNLR